MGAFGMLPDLTEHRGAVPFRQVEVEEYQVGTRYFVGLTHALNVVESLLPVPDDMKLMNYLVFPE